VFEKIKTWVQDNPELTNLSLACGYGVVCYSLGVYVGRQTVDPVKLLSKSPDLWIQITRESFSKFDEGKSLICWGTPVGNLAVSRIPSEAAVKILALTNGKV
jgi:hypothetical protein